MSAPASWHKWRKSCLPVLESILAAGSKTTLKSDGAVLGSYSSQRRLSTSPSLRSNINARLNKDVDDRRKEIETATVNPYPRYFRDGRYMTLREFRRTYDKLEPGETQEYRRRASEVQPGEQLEKRQIEVSGRITSVRKFGSKLFFINIVEGRGHTLQVLLNYGPLQESDVSQGRFTRFSKLLRRGDSISVKGYPHRTDTNELSIKAANLPTLLSPCLHPYPVETHKNGEGPKPEAQNLERHVEMLVNLDAIKIIVRRFEITRQMREFFSARGFVEVQTPILASTAGGAAARPFETTATEFPDRNLKLRIAPELWLKRLIIGGMDKIYEIGPSFRNEGLDKTHNPEFTTCEFYATYTALPQLIDMTQSLLHSIAQVLQRHRATASFDIPLPFPLANFAGPYPQIDFIPALNAALDLKLPNLASPTASTEVLEIFRQKALPLPPQPHTLPRLLDKLSAIYLEPECVKPTWITYHPECLSPLSKSFIHPSAPHSQPVAARAELFIHGKEIVNCYEEENAPAEQRRKFVAQQALQAAHDDEAMGLDEDYLRALAWGLPPTGGWGCGIDRLVMLFCGKERISDVLSFGNLRAVSKGPGSSGLATLWKSVQLDGGAVTTATPEDVARKKVQKTTDEESNAEVEKEK